ncbi:rod shape-determining protein MreD [Staphylospora marina]|uniref:rod shape-determining protein MreD n=1 Tax=Staphylospora marina TaxID=2490858 RepID=UPI0013DE36E9|nr:rod shape-determining protein MreD [Staphylospora marina]
MIPRLALFLFFVFLLEGSLAVWLLPQTWGSPFVVMPQWVLPGIVAAAEDLDERALMLTGAGFGLLHDIVYGPAIGIHAFCTGAAAWLSAKAAREFPPVGWLTGLTAASVLFVWFLMVYGWMVLFGFTAVSFDEALFFHIMPSVLFDAVTGYPVSKGVSMLLPGKRNLPIQLFR